MKHYEELVEEFQLESYEEKDDKFFFTAKALSKDFECEKGRGILAEKSKNRDYVWRHQHPIEEGNFETHIYGYVVDSWLEGVDKEIFSKYEIYGHTKDHLALREIIKERKKVGDPLGVSMRYRKYFDDAGNIIHYDVLEHSGTPYPACSDCKTINYEVINMTNEDKKEEVKKEENEENKSFNKIEELEKLLDSKTKIIDETKLELDKLKKDVALKEKELEKKSIEEKSLEDQIKEMRLEIEFLSTKKPIIDKILEVKEIDERMLNFLKAQDPDYLKGKLEDFSKEAVKPHVKSQEDSANESKEKMEEEVKEKDVAFEQFTQLLNLNSKDKK